MKLTLTKETVRTLAVKSKLRTGAGYNNVIGIRVKGPTEYFSNDDCKTGIGTGGYDSGGAPGGCHTGPNPNNGDPAPLVGSAGAFASH